MRCSATGACRARQVGKAYLIVDHRDARVLRDPCAVKPRVLFCTTQRVGGGAQNSDAIKVMKFADS